MYRILKSWLVKLLTTWAIFLFLVSGINAQGMGINAIEIVNANEDTVFASISNNDTIELYQHTEISFIANTSGSLSKVEFYWNGTFARSESSAPYCISGDAAGNYHPWYTFDLNILQQLKAYAYSGTSIVDSMIVSFVLINSGPPRIPAPPITYSCSGSFDVLVYHEDAGTGNPNNQSAINLIQSLGQSNSFTVTIDATGTEFDNLQTLKEFEVVIFANTYGNNILTSSQKQNFEYYIQQGGGFVGIHNAANTFRNGSWPWYNELVGAIPRVNPMYTPTVLNASINKTAYHTTNSNFPASTSVSDRYFYWDGFQGYFSVDNNILLEVTSTGSQSYDNARPVAWYKEYDGGRSYYTALGYDPSMYSNPGNNEFIQNLLDGIKWAADKKLIICGEYKKWHTLDFTLTGPYGYEHGENNFFLDYRLEATFVNGSEIFVVPGYFAADGYSAESGSYSGDKWRLHFVPNKTGVWNYTISFVNGPEVAINNDPGTPVSLLDGLSGSFTITPTNKTGKDFRAKGRLEYVGDHYLQFAETEEYFIKGGINSPENFLGYFDFDGTYDNAGSFNDLVNSVYADGLHHYDPHVQDWNQGDPVWQQNKGKSIIGAINYLSSKKVNSVYMLVNNVEGDGREVFPWSSYQERLRFDISKLNQWNVVFTHMQKQGIVAHLVLQEEENDQLLDNGDLGVQRKLYYREMIARFSHHLGLNWNMGEENSNTDQQRKDFATYFKNTDPYKNHITVHTGPGDHNTVYTPLLGYPDVDGASVQTDVPGVHSTTRIWRNNSANAGLKWIINMDEIGPPEDGAIPDGPNNNHAEMREEVLWGNLMGGGAGVEWYFGYDHPNNDLDCEDFRTRQDLLRHTNKAVSFFKNYLPFTEMEVKSELTTTINDDYCFAKPGELYAIYLPENLQSTNIDLELYTDTFTVQWYNPRSGAGLHNGSITSITGPGIVSSIGLPPGGATSKDWVALITSNSSNSLGISAVVNQPTCFSGNDGLITVTANGGALPYSYLWSDGSTNNFLTASSGIFTVTVTDANNNSITLTEELVDPLPIIVQSQIANIPCAGFALGSAKLFVSGGEAPYNYSWSTNPGLNAPIYTNMTGGYHSVTIADNKGCSLEKSIWINEPAPLMAVYIPKQPSCNGTNDGAINLLIAGGVAPYKYNWSNGAQSEDIQNLSAGMYHVQITDANSCAKMITVVLNNPAPIEYVPNISDVSAPGGNDGNIVLTITSAVSPYQISWVHEPMNHSNSAFNLSTGYYSYLITDGNGCAILEGQTVNEPGSIIKTSEDIVSESSFFYLQPNPVNETDVMVQFVRANEFTTTLSLINSIGKTLYSTKLKAEKYNYTLPLSDLKLPSGVYYVKMKNEELNEVVKLLVY